MPQTKRVPKKRKEKFFILPEIALTVTKSLDLKTILDEVLAKVISEVL